MKDVSLLPIDKTDRNDVCEGVSGCVGEESRVCFSLLRAEVAVELGMETTSLLQSPLPSAGSSSQPALQGLGLLLPYQKAVFSKAQAEASANEGLNR